MGLRRKLTSESFAKKVLIFSVVVLAICGAIILFSLFGIYDLAGKCLNNPGCDESGLGRTQNIIQAIIWVARICIALMILSGIILALRKEKTPKEPQKEE